MAKPNKIKDSFAVIFTLSLTKVYFFRYTSSIKQNILNMLWYNIKALAMNKQSLLIDQLEVNRLLID